MLGWIYDLTNISHSSIIIVYGLDTCLCCRSGLYLYLLWPIRDTESFELVSYSH